METLNGAIATIGNLVEVAKSFLVIGAMIWIVYRLFILTKRIVRGWGKND